MTKGESLIDQVAIGESGVLQFNEMKTFWKSEFIKERTRSSKSARCFTKECYARHVFQERALWGGFSSPASGSLGLMPPAVIKRVEGER